MVENAESLWYRLWKALSMSISGSAPDKAHLNLAVNVLNAAVIVHIKCLKSTLGRGQIESDVAQIKSKGCPSAEIAFSLDCVPHLKIKSCGSFRSLWTPLPPHPPTPGLEASDPVQWHYMNTDQNLMDHAFRGLKVSGLITLMSQNIMTTCLIWFVIGPLLTNSHYCWPHTTHTFGVRDSLTQLPYDNLVHVKANKIFIPAQFFCIKRYKNWLFSYHLIYSDVNMWSE